MGGSCVIVIDPSHFGPIDGVKDRSDRFVRAVKSTAKLPGVDEIFLPGERGHKSMETNQPVSVLESHWQPFVDRVAKYGLDIDTLRTDWQGTRV